jgi:HAMP domain-containing protein
MAKEALDGVTDERPFAGVHILATALLCAAGSTDDELDLARRLLEQDPRRDAPREIESVAGAFNRHMDAAIDSVNASSREPTRVGRRARLAADLDRADLVLMDRAMVAALMIKIGDLKGAVERLRDELARADDGEDLGAELAADEDLALLNADDCDRCAGRVATGPCTCPATYEPASTFAAEEEYIGDVGRDPLGNPSVND